MSKFDRYSNDEIATEMHVSAKAVEYHITQALKKLRIRLSHLAIYAAVMIFLQ
jgi:RNA polymerase sigma-70 factor (ECF subfamily)